MINDAMLCKILKRVLRCFPTSFSSSQWPPRSAYHQTQVEQSPEACTGDYTSEDVKHKGCMSPLYAPHEILNSFCFSRDGSI